MNKQITNHKMYSTSDYNYLRGKGYSNKEIVAIWTRDMSQGHNQPLTHKAAPDVVGMLNSK